MKKICSLMILIMGVIFCSIAKPLSDKAVISVVTCGTGAELYSCFGHTALRVKDPPNNIDLVYNYGTFNFNTSNFYLHFTRGTLQYHLSVAPYNQFYQSYVGDNRSLTEQKLNLNKEQKANILEALKTALLPENKFYRYQFFTDNCTTRIYELIKKTTGKLSIDSSYQKDHDSYRSLYSKYVKKHPWLNLGMDLCLGIETDYIISLEQRLFLPLEFEQALDNCTIDNQNIVANKHVLFTSLKPLHSAVHIWESIPFIITSIIASILLLISFIPLLTKSVDVLIFGSTALIGMILFSLSLFSLHTPTHNNLNILWLSPLNILLFIQRSNIKKQYSFLYSIFLALICLINLFINYFDIVAYPVIILLIIRLYKNTSI